MKSILALLATLLFSSTAMAASGTINIQASQQGAKYLVVRAQDLIIAARGISPYFDTNFATGKYKVCFEFAGYATVWQDAIVQTSGSSWVGPVMKKSAGIAQVTCEEELTVKKTWEDSRPLPMATSSSTYYPPGVSPVATNNQRIIELEKARLESKKDINNLSSNAKRILSNSVDTRLRQLESNPEQYFYNKNQEPLVQKQFPDSAIDPTTGESYPHAGNGIYIDPQTGRAVPTY